MKFLQRFFFAREQKNSGVFFEKKHRSRYHPLSPVFYLLIISLVAITACQKSNNRADLIIINGAEPESLDPAIVTGQPDGRVVSELFEGLLRFNRKGEVEPGVDSSWKISADQQTYTFYLRPDAKWSDGKDIRAQDFVNSWRRTLQPETGSAYSYQLFVVKGAEDFFTGKEKKFSKVGVSSLDDHTLQVTLAEPTLYFLYLCAYTTLFPVRIDLINRVGDNWVKPEEIICNGPYKLIEWRLNDKIRLERNPFYWDVANVHLKSIDLLPISQPNVAYNFYAAGQADLSFAEVPLSLLHELKKGNDFHSAILLGVDFIRFNCTKVPCSDVRVRKALALCIDQKRIIKKLSDAIPAESFLPSGIAGYQPALGIGYNPQRARELLAEAGYPAGKDFPLTTYLYNETEITEAIAVELQAAWKKELGISVLLAHQEWKVFLSSLKNRDYTLARSSWVGDYPDPNTFLDLFTSESGNNRTGWKSKTYDNLMQQASRELEPKKRFEFFQQAEKILIDEEVPIVPLFFYTAIQLYDPKRLGGIEGNLLNRHPLREIYKITKQYLLEKK
ncbi:MAG: peptide ABC transporter substrate-binding protein [Chthoniobacterales bacterium]